MSLILSGCADRGAGLDAAESVAAERRRPNLPAPPATFGKPVPQEPLRAGQDARAALARSRAGHAEANRRLADDDAFYSGVRQQFGAAPAPAPGR